LSVNNNYYAGSAARTNLAQGSAAIASWLNSINNNGGPPAGVGTPPQNGPAPTVSGGGSGTPTVSMNFTQLQESDQASLQPANQNASDYQQAVAAYGDN